MLAPCPEPHEQLNANRAAELGALLARLNLGGENILFEGIFKYMARSGNPPEIYSHTNHQGKMTISRDINPRERRYFLTSPNFRTQFQAEKDALWTFNFSDPSKSSAIDLSISLRLNDAGLYEARLYSTLGLVEPSAKPQA